MKALAVSLFLVCSLVRLFAAPPVPWDAPAFSIPPETAAAAAADVHGAEKDDVVVLYEEDSFTYNEAGAALHTYRVTYKILTRQGISRWSTASCWWQPWRQDTPSIRGRVIGKDGHVSILDPATIADITPTAAAPDVYSDSRTLQAPLPSLELGCVVEYIIEIADRAPLLAAGSAERVWFGHYQPVLLRRLLIDYPQTMVVRYLTRREPSVTPVREQKAGRISLRFEAANIPSLQAPEDFMPWDATGAPCVDFSTGKNWKEVARSYAAATDPLLDGVPLRGYAKGTAGSAPSAGTALVSHILYQVRKDVRYTGINFGVNAIIPHPPLETLKRGFGDCKDQAVLLAAALRAAGIKAQLALLMSGDDPDVASELPGFGLFNHAIVYIPATGMWIDPTADFYPAGELPGADQGRKALVIGNETVDLVLTPESPASRNWYREVREFHLSEAGPASVVETTTMGGIFEADYRQNFDRNTAAASRERLEKYVKNEYNAESLARWSVSDPRATDVPFALTVEGAKSSEGNTDESAAVVYVRGGGLLGFLPDLLTREDTAGAPFTRTNSLRLPYAFVTEYVFHIIAPPGYRAAALPPDESVQIGPAVLTKVFKLNEDGSVLSTLRLECPRRLCTASEAVEMHRAIRTFQKGQASVVTFEQIGESLLAAGKFNESLEEFRALVRLHPLEARHRVQISRALLAAGFGKDAEAEGRRAVELEAGSAYAHGNLAWILLHDMFGRPFVPGANLPAARAEYEAALKIDPSRTDYARNMAILDEYDSNMVRYGAGAHLEEAVAGYRSIKGDIEDTSSMENLYLDLFYLGRYQDVVDGLRRWSPNDALKALLVAALAAVDGPAAAQKEAARIVPSSEDRRTILNSAAEFLLKGRRYPECAELMIAGARGTPNLTKTMAFAEFFRTLAPASTAPGDDSTARGLVADLLKVILGDRSTADRLPSLMAASIRKAYQDPGEDSETSKALGIIRGALSRLPVPPATLMDLVIGMIDVQTLSIGDATAALMVVGIVPDAPPTVFYLTKEEGAFRLLDAQGSMSGIARECLMLVDAGRLKEANDWFQLVRTQHSLSAKFPDFTASPLIKLLPDGNATAEEIRRAAGCILAESGTRLDAALGVSLLFPLWRSETDASRRLALEGPLAEGLMTTGNLIDLRSVATRFVQDAPEDTRALKLLSASLGGQGAGADAEKMIRARLSAHPDDRVLKRMLAQWLGGAGRYSEALSLCSEILDSSDAELSDYNSYAWYSLYVGKLDPAVVTKRQLVQRLLEGNSSVLHTLVCMLADSGRILEAHEVFGKYLDLLGTGPTEAATWLAYGMLAQRFGLADTAVSAFQKVTVDPWEAHYPGISSYHLAQIHLDQMKKSP